MTWLNHFSLGLILLIYLKNDHSNSMEKNRDIFLQQIVHFVNSIMWKLTVDVVPGYQRASYSETSVVIFF